VITGIDSLERLDQALSVARESKAALGEGGSPPSWRALSDSRRRLRREVQEQPSLRRHRAAPPSGWGSAPGERSARNSRADAVPVSRMKGRPSASSPMRRCPRATSRGSTCFSKLSKCASITLSGIWTVSKRKPLPGRYRAFLRWIRGDLWPVNPRKRALRLPGGDHGLDRAAGGEGPLGIVVADHLVELEQIDVIRS